MATKIIKEWNDLEGLENGLGLKIETKTAHESSDKALYSRQILLKENDTSPAINLDYWYKHQLDYVVNKLRKYGFDIQYEKPFNLVEFLKKNIQPEGYVSDNKYHPVYYIEIEFAGGIRLVEEEGDRSVEVLGVRYFTTNNVSSDYINQELDRHNHDKEKFIDAMKELGWL